MTTEEAAERIIEIIESTINELLTNSDTKVKIHYERDYEEGGETFIRILVDVYYDEDTAE